MIAAAPSAALPVAARENPAGNRTQRRRTAVSPIRSALAVASPFATTAAVGAVMVEIATGLHGLMFGLVVLFMVADGCLGALRAERCSAEVYRKDEDRRGLRKRTATIIVILVLFLTDAFFVAASRQAGIWPGVFEVGWCTLAALTWAGRIELMSIYRNSVAIFGKRDSPKALQVMAEGSGAVSDFAVDIVAGAIEGGRDAAARRGGRRPQG
jgi:hypothetical protein